MGSLTESGSAFMDNVYWRCRVGSGAFGLQDFERVHRISD